MLDDRHKQILLAHLENQVQLGNLEILIHQEIHDLKQRIAMLEQKVLEMSNDKN